MFASKRTVTLASVLVLALILASWLACQPIGLGQYDDDDDSAEDTGPDGATDPEGDGAAIFGYCQYEDDDSVDMDSYFVQQVSDKLGEEVMHGSWDINHYWAVMTKFNVGDEQYLMGHGAVKGQSQDASTDWWIQRIFETGDLGKETQSGTWANYYDTLVGAKAGNNTFIFGQSHYYKSWFIQQVMPGGTLGPQTASGTWHDSYPVAVPLEMNNATYIYFQSDVDESSMYYWFIAELTDQGQLVQTDDGYWNNFYISDTALEINDEWYIFGLRKPTWESKGVWFIQSVGADGKMGEQTDNDDWGDFYQTITSFKDGEHCYLFGQNKDSMYWFIQRVDGGGTMGDQTDSGTWNYYYDYVLPLTFKNVYLASDDWMSQISETIGDRKLIDITLPGSHDAGVNKEDFDLLDDCYGGASSCNTTAQNVDIYGQLMYGSRYFDIRPVYMATNYDEKDWSLWTTGHFTVVDTLILGCKGESLTDVFADVNKFFADGAHPKELVILKISHCMDQGYDCDSDGFDLIKSHANSDLTNLVKCDDDCNLMDMTLNEILAKGNVIVLIDGVKSDKAKGIFSWSDGDLPIYDDYSNSENVGTMSSDQYSKMRDPDNHDNQLFLLSWTLTLSDHDAKYCSANGTSILKFAADAHDALMPDVGDWLDRGLINQDFYPNILYLDAFDQSGTRAAIYLNLYHDADVLWNTKTYNNPGAYYRMQGDGNLVVYTATDVKAIWSTHTYGNPGATLVMQDDGNLVIRATNGDTLWSSNTSGHPGAKYEMLSDGNFVIFAKDGELLWSSKTNGYPGAYYKMQGDGNLVIYYDFGDQALWASGTAGHPGAQLSMGDDGNLVIYYTSGSVPLPIWATNTSGNPGAVLVMQPNGDLQVTSVPWTR